MEGNIDEKIAKEVSNNVPLLDIAGRDFLVVSDTDPHTGEIYAITVLADTVFSSILVNGSNCVTAKGLSGVTVPVGTFLPFRKFFASSVTLTSGKVILYTK